MARNKLAAIVVLTQPLSRTVIGIQILPFLVVDCFSGWKSLPA